MFISHIFGLSLWLFFSVGCEFDSPLVFVPQTLHELTITLQLYYPHGLYPDITRRIQRWRWHWEDNMLSLLLSSSFALWPNYYTKFAILAQWPPLLCVRDCHNAAAAAIVIEEVDDDDDDDDVYPTLLAKAKRQSLQDSNVYQIHGSRGVMMALVQWEGGLYKLSRHYGMHVEHGTYSDIKHRWNTNLY